MIVPVSPSTLTEVDECEGEHLGLISISRSCELSEEVGQEVQTLAINLRSLKSLKSTVQRYDAQM